MKHLFIAIVILPILSAMGIELHTLELTRIELDTAETIGRISPLLFGHNLEITRQGIRRGLSAEMVANRKFAAGKEGFPKRWNTIGGNGPVKFFR